jgi:hypothetical protein
MADSTLVAIMKKVRRLTRRPSELQLQETELKQYINTFIQFDLPYHVRTFNRLLEFTTETLPNQPNRVITQPTDIITIEPPFYIAGRQVWFQQDPEIFFRAWPKNQFLENSGQFGNGIALNFTGTIDNTPILPNEVLISSIGLNNSGLRVVDDGFGDLSGTGFGTIDYLTGEWDVTFSNPPDPGQEIILQYIPYKPARPTSVLWYNSQLTFRPVPDQVYNVSFQAQVRPTELLDNTDFPDLQQWWQYIAYGAAKKIFEDAMDLEGVESILPEFQTQEELVMRTVSQQIKNERTATIYTDMIDGTFGSRSPFNR